MRHGFFEHDCETCRFLGRYRGYDLYVHENKERKLSTLLARWGDRGPEYLSGHPGYHFDSVLAEADRRFREETVNDVE